MGGEGSGRKPSEATIVRRLSEPKTPIASARPTGEFFLPNTSNLQDGLRKQDINIEDKFLNVTGDIGTGQFILGGTETTALSFDFSDDTVGQWKLNDNEADTNVLDSSGNSYTGTATTNTSNLSTTGKINNAFNFNGTTEYVNLDTHIANFSGLTEGSICCWFKSTATNQITFFSISDSNVASGEYMVGLGDTINSDDGKVIILHRSLDVAKLSAETQTRGQYNDGEWHHVVFTVDSTGNVLYIDGNPVTLSYGTGSSSTSYFFSNLSGADKLTIGANKDNGASYQWFMNGDLDDIRILNRALTYAEVKALYNLGNGTEDTSGNTVFSHQTIGSTSNVASNYGYSDLEDLVVEGMLEAQEGIRAENLFSSDGTAGITRTFTVSDGVGTLYELIFKNGLLVSQEET